MTFDPDRRAPHDHIAFIVTASWWGSACTLLYGLATNRWTPFAFTTSAGVFLWTCLRIVSAVRLSRHSDRLANQPPPRRAPQDLPPWHREDRASTASTTLQSRRDN